MSYFNLEPTYKFKLNSLPRGKKSAPITNSCNIPSHVITVDFNSNCLLCDCDGWLPIPVGKVLDFATLDEVWTSPLAQLLQKDIDDKKYTWCAVDHCGIKQRNKNRINYQLLLNIDESCNLACPSCRRENIMHIGGPEVEEKIQGVNRIISWLEQFDKPIHIVLSGNGDPLASTIIRPLFKNFNPKSTQTFKLFTNGLLIKKQLIDSAVMPQVTEISISVDAGSSEVYEKVRVGGNWSVLLENFEFLKTINKSAITTLNFAVQNTNFNDIPNFVEVCNRYGFNGSLHQLDDWGTWNNNIVKNPDAWTIKNGTFMDHNVLTSDHINFEKCRQIVKELIESKNTQVQPNTRLRQLLNL